MKNYILFAFLFTTSIAICQTHQIDVTGVTGQTGIQVTGGRDGLVITNSSERAAYLGNSPASNLPALQLQAGSDANMDLRLTGHARIQSDGSFVFYLDQNDNATDRLVVVNSDIEDVFEINESGNAIIHNKLSIPTPSDIGLEIQGAGNDGILINNSFDSGINVFGAGGHGGYFNTAATSPDAAVEASAGDDSNIDLRLNGHGKLATGGNLDIYLDDNDNASNQFAIHKSSAGPFGTELFSVKESGQLSAIGKLSLGLASNTPTGYILSVDGKIIAEELVVQLSGNWPDYVFDESYNKMNLDDLQHFIEKNGHLPQIPSADEIENKGLTIGEMQRIQMEKIEELTLYILDLHNEIEALKAAK